MSHVALLIPTIDRLGGAERQVLLLAHELARRGWRVTVVTLSGSGNSAAAELRSAGIGYLSLSMRKGLADPRGWFRFNRWLTRHRPDVVHAHLPHATWFARWSRLFAPPCVVVDTIHTSATGSRGRRLGYRLSDWLPDAVTAVSHSVADAYLAARMVAPAHFEVVPNGIDPSDWTPDQTERGRIRRELGLDGEFVWLAAGRLEPVKDYPTLLRAFQALAEPAARLFIAGSGVEEANLHRLVQELGIEEQVRILGFQADLRRWMRAADGFVVSSLWEGLPVAVLEASACGLPTVATGVPGNLEAVLHGQTGLLTAPRQPAALAAGMRQLQFTSPTVRRSMGERAQQLVTERYSLDRVLDQWESLYGRLLDRPAASVTLAHSGDV